MIEEKYIPLVQPIDYEGFRLFMATYLENDIPEELCQHLFTSFKSKTGAASPDRCRAAGSVLGELFSHLFDKFFIQYTTRHLNA